MRIFWDFADSSPAPRIMAITTPANHASWGLMQRLGMVRRADLDFDHPLLAPDDLLCAHITYVAERPQRASPPA